jgi:prevent-host-death family protein
MMVHMRRTSLVQAKAHLSELVDLAEHKGQRVLICRHGKPAAALVPVHVANAPTSEPGHRRMTRKEAIGLLDRLARGGDPSFDALEDLQEGRSRLDRIGV